MFFDPFKKPVVRDCALLLTLLLINIFCYHRTLNGYFLADDFVHVPYLVKVFNGHPDLLLQNFYTNWVQAQGTQFYRPFISLTLAFDYAIWKANPLGYHVSNFVFQVCSSIFLFLTTRRLFHFHNEREANTLGFLTAAFFSACPLHPEVVSWVIARVDSVQSTFLLAGFWLYLRTRDGAKPTFNKALSLACFVIALLSKEMAITLPPTLFLFELIKSDKNNFLDKIKNAVKQTWQYWLILAIYMGVRTAALGTISGGYAGSIGQGLSSSLVKRWFQDGAFNRILLPLNAELQGSTHRLINNLKLLYEFAAALLIARLALLSQDGSLSVYLRRLLFASGWFVIAMLPTYQVFNLTETLQGSRFIYLGTAPLCLLLALLVVPLQFQSFGLFKRTINIASTVLVVLMLWTFMQLTYQNNSAWAQANKGVRAFRHAVANWFGADSRSSSSKAHADSGGGGQIDHSNGKNLVVLNIPQRFAGAHMIYNAATLGVLLSQPLTQQNLTKRVVTFEPIEFGDSELINVSRLRRLIAEQDKNQFVRWDSNLEKLVPIYFFNPKIENRNIAGTENTGSRTPGNESFVVSPVLDIPATSVDFVQIDLSADKPLSSTDVAIMSWNTDNDPTFRTERTMAKAIDKNNHLELAVSERKNWVLSGTIHQLKFDLPNGVSVKRIALLNGSELIPTIAPDTSALASDGRTVREDEGGVSRPGKQIGPFIYDISKVKGADHAVVEISKPDSWFEHYSGTYRDKTLSKETSLVKSLQARSGSFTTPANQLSQPGFYEIRVCAVDKDGKLVGFPSDPIDLQFSAEDIRK